LRLRSRSPLARSRVRVSFGFAFGFIHAGNCAHWASILDDNRSGSSRQHGWLQTSQYYRRPFTLIHHWCRKIFDRCIVQYRRVIICVLLSQRCNITSRKVGRVYGWVLVVYKRADRSRLLLRHGSLPAKEEVLYRIRLFSNLQVEQKSYRIPPQDEFTAAHFLTVADIERATSIAREGSSTSWHRRHR
jgi:hypothetical protein